MSGRVGFTLVEVLVAMAVAALVLTTAGAVFSTTIDAMMRLERHRAALDREMNGHRWLHSALRSVDMTAGTGDAFSGSADGVRFRARVLAADGWFEHANIEVSVMNGALVAVGGTPEPVELVSDVSGATFDYLARCRADAPWLRGWQSRLSAPVAIRVRAHRETEEGTATDTLLFPMGVTR